MKKVATPRLKRLFIDNRKSGVALVIVLAILVLITLLVVAFYQTVTRDQAESASFSARITAQQLADSAIDLVIAQIREATSGFEKTSTGAPIYTSPLAWASQPGAIRTYRQNGDPYRIYKLYSARRLITTTAAELTTGGTNSDIPNDWASRTALYTDLNAPVTNREGVTLYPIADPQTAGIITEGFSYAGAPTTGTTNPLPMPAQWIYVLKDGTLTSPTVSSSTGSIAAWGSSGSFSPSSTNPIIGRIAFWTDDDTSKVNINTASDGHYWDTPRANFVPEHALANYQPANREYQSFPGHPATTSLVPVFFFNGTSTPTLSLAQHNALLDLVPRINGGGSNRGTVIATTPVTLDNQRIYAFVDELIYANTPTGARALQNPVAGITRQRIDATRFFLTAHSRAPETTLFNTPRVAIWPVDSDPDNRTAVDNLIAFCSTVGGRPFYFQRNNPRSSTFDFYNIPRNPELFAYLRRLTNHTFPGFGTNYCLVPDNNTTTANLKSSAPRYTSFATKYGIQNRDHLLTQIFDYIRITNTDDAQHADSTSARNARRYGNRSLFDLGLPYIHSIERQLGLNQVLPIRINPPETSVPTRGHGRFPTVTEAVLHFICNADPAVPGSNTVTGPNANVMLGGTALAAGQRRIEAMFFVETFIPAHGYPWVHPSYVIEISGLDQFTINGSNLNFPAQETTMVRFPGYWIYDTRAMGGFFSHRIYLKDARVQARGSVPQDSGYSVWHKYPFVSFPITITVPVGPNPTMSFTGGLVTIRIYNRSSLHVHPYHTPADLVQTIQVRFPDATFPVPNLVTSGSASTPFAPATSAQNWWAFRADGAISGFNGRVHYAEFSTISDACGNIFRQGDVVRSMVPVHGDYRILSALQNVPESMFTTHPDYNNVNARFAHNISEGLGANYLRGFKEISNALVPTSGYGSGTHPWPDVPHPHTNSTLGDWDNLMSYIADAPGINKPDEGNQFRAAAGQIPYFHREETYEIYNNTFFSAVRQAPSPFMFGSLSTGVHTNTPYRTLLFRPEHRLDASGNLHFGLRVPRDHLLADLFWMPVVEPYAISEPFSTAGKVNMNYRIAPYNYIRRATGLHAVLFSERVAAINVNSSVGYKAWGTDNAINAQIRLPIDRNATLSQFEKIFDANQIFRSPTEIADLQIVPQGQTISTVEDPNGFWQTHRLTGDNLREKIYTTLLPRLTTKSNTYTVHFRVQVLQQRKNSPNFLQWDDAQDQILAEYRGSATIERYLDPRQPNLPDFAQMDPSDTSSLPDYNIDNFYRFRTINVRRFAP